MESLTTWSGLTNPRPAITGLYVAVADSQVSPVGAPYTVVSERLSCTDPWSGGSNCGGSPGAYRFVFSDGSTEAMRLEMGETRDFAFRGGTLVVRNLRSYETGYCDDPGQYGHWAAEQLPAL